MEKRFLNAMETFWAGNNRLRTFLPFPDIDCRDAYDKLPKALRTALVAQGEKYLGYDYPAIRATDFMKFKRTGNRVDFENLYFERRYALNALTVAECAEDKGRFIDDIVNGIFAVCEESAWQLPPHNSYVRNAPQEILPDASRPVLDLFACETGAQLACVRYLLGSRLDKVSTFINARIGHELERRIILPYTNRHFWWMGREGEPMCNWTPWCTQNVLLAAFLCGAFSGGGQDGNPRGMSSGGRQLGNPHGMSSGGGQDGNPRGMSSGGGQDGNPRGMSSGGGQLGAAPGALSGMEKAVTLKAAESLDFFLKDYGEDGCCDEGAQYFRHAGLCLDGAADILNQMTDGAFTKLYEWDKIKNIASYISNVHVDGKYYINFADCSPVAGRAGVREFLFGRRTHQPELMLFAAKDFKAAKGDLFADESNRLSLYYRMQTLFHYQDITDYDTSGTAAHKDIYYPSVGLFLSRNDTFCLAVKAGDNDDSHNHNDTGSFTLYKNGRPLFIDIGVESYTAKTFSSRRYEIWTMQSCYHNLPSIEGLDQHDGPDYCAKDVKTSFDDAKSSISMELSGAYPLKTCKKHYTREVFFDKLYSRVLLTDTTDAGDVILNFITYEKPEITQNRILVGTLAHAVFSGAIPLALEVLPITDARLQTAWDHELYRIRLTMTGTKFKLEVK